MKEIDKEFLTAKEISKYLLVPVNTIYRLTKNNKIKAIKIGRQWRYPKADVEELLESGIHTDLVSIKGLRDADEKRMFPRINCNIHCEYKIDIFNAKHFYSVTGNIRNISGGGVLLCDNEDSLIQIDVDDPIELFFTIPSEEGGLSISAQGRVVRKNGTKAIVHAIGIEFRNIDKYYQNEIINYVD